MRNKVVILSFALMSTLFLRQPCCAALINEILFNVPDGSQFFELRGTASESLNGLTLVVIDGDGSDAGQIDLAVGLTSFSIGALIPGESHGLFLWRDSLTLLNPAPHPNANFNTADLSDFETGSQTVLLVNGFNGIIGDDVDSGLPGNVSNDGILDNVRPWTSVMDGIGFRDGSGTDHLYAAQLGFQQFTGLSFNPDTIARRLNGEWIAADVNGSPSDNPSYSYIPANIANLSGNPIAFSQSDIQYATPGNVNAVPEPGAAILLGIVSSGIWIARRCRRNETRMSS